jgi:hypothetical protein
LFSPFRRVSQKSVLVAALTAVRPLASFQPLRCVAGRFAMMHCAKIASNRVHRLFEPMRRLIVLSAVSFSELLRRQLRESSRRLREIRGGGTPALAAVIAAPSLRLRL